MHRRSFIKGSLALGMASMAAPVAIAEPISTTAVRFVPDLRARGGSLWLSAMKKDGKAILDFWHQPGRTTPHAEWREFCADWRHVIGSRPHRQAVVDRLLAEVRYDFNAGERISNRTASA